MTQEMFNVTFVTDRVSLITTVEAEDRGDAHTKALAEISEYLGLDLVPVRYQLEVEEV